MPMSPENEDETPPWSQILAERRNLPKEAVEAALGFTKQEMMPTMLQFLAENLPQGIARDHIGKEDIERQLLILLSQFRPSSLQEALMAIHLLAVNQTAIDCLRRANEPGVSDERRDRYLGHMLRFMNLSSSMNQALAKLQRGGNQRITVERVNVGEGGQAIVGHVETREKPAAIEHKRRVPLTPQDWLIEYEAAKERKK
jgi:hypothetical protein